MGSHQLPRIAVLAVLSALVVGSNSVCLAEISQGNLIIRLDTVASGLTAPIGATHAGDGSRRLFIFEQSGQIRIVENGQLRATPFLDISHLIPPLDPGFDERGLLGLAFHPDYANNGRFFLRYSKARQGQAPEPCFGTSRACHEEVLAEFSVSANDPNVADPTPHILFRVDEPEFNHDAGQLAFGPDGLLYFALGDGGGAHDGLDKDPPPHGPTGHGQNIETALGAMLRIDVDRPPEAGLGYALPPDNPFRGQAGRDEIYAYGFRNPYKFSFDDGPGGDGSLYVADVGQNLFEEVDRVLRGGNYGWAVREGFSCFDPLAPMSPPQTCADSGALGEPLLDPIVDYSHAEGGITVIGGFVYRGTRSPELVGAYVFGDFSDQFGTPGGRLYYLPDPTAGEIEIKAFQIGAADLPYGLFLKGFGEGEEGELYACGSSALAPFGATGLVQRIVVEGVIEAGDLNRDGCLDQGDYGLLIDDIRGATPRNPEHDLNGDGQVTVADARTLIQRFSRPRGAACGRARP